MTTCTAVAAMAGSPSLRAMMVYRLQAVMAPIMITSPALKVMLKARCSSPRVRTSSTPASPRTMPSQP
jgi:hypothetical protein